MLFDDTEFGYFTEAERKARRAFELYEDGRMPQALAELETAIELNPSNSSLHFNKGLTLDSINRFDDAISEYEIALEIAPSDMEILNSLAIDYTRTGQYDLAIDTFEYIEQLSPSFEPCYCNRIITYTEMGLHDLAEQMFYLAQQLDSDCPLCYYNIGNSLFVRGDYKRAIHCWLRTAELEPAHPQIDYRIAQAYWADGNNEHAREYFLRELRTSPGDVDVILDFGLFLLENDDTESAKEKFNRILELTPDSAAALFYLAEIAFAEADYERAIPLYEQALETDGTLVGPHYRLAQYALMTGRQNHARNYIAAELRLAPEDDNVLVSIGSMFLALGDIDTARNSLLKAVDSNSSNADAYYYLGLADVLQGRWDDAMAFFANVLDIAPNDVRALRESALVCLATGRLSQAAEHIRKAKALPGSDASLNPIARKLRCARAIERTADLLGRYCPRFIRRLARRIASSCRPQ